MKKRLFVLFTLLLAISGIGLPIWLALEESARQAFKMESMHALGFARDVVLRADQSGMQVQRGMGRLARLHGKAPCAPASVDLMRQIDLASSYIQAVGYVEDGRIVCSSIAGTMGQYALGPLDYRSVGGAGVRRNVRFPFAPMDVFVVIEYHGFAAVLHKQLAIDTAKSEPDVALAVVSLGIREPLVARGHIDAAWIDRLGTAQERVFTDQGYVVAVARSPRFKTAGIAAVPLSYLHARTDNTALRLVPVGLVAGVLLTAAILHLARQQMALPFAVKLALRRKELFMEYQPIIELATGRMTGVEALVRWRRQNGEIVPPDLFIPIAEEHGLMVQVTREVLRLVCRDAGPFLENHPFFHVGVNVSAADFHSPDFLTNLRATLGNMQASPSNLMLEITERGLLDPIVARETTGSLRRAGFSVAIDDFGTGYSSLSYLESLELDYLKIDRSFIEAIGTGAPTSQVVGHIIRMAKDLGLRMIAEGVEGPAQAEFLRKHGVQFGQGWQFGRPMAFAEIIRQLEAVEQAEAALARAAG